MVLNLIKLTSFIRLTFACCIEISKFISVAIWHVTLPRFHAKHSMKKQLQHAINYYDYKDCLGSDHNLIMNDVSFIKILYGNRRYNQLRNKTYLDWTHHLGFYSKTMLKKAARLRTVSTFTLSDNLVSNLINA